MQHSHSSSSSLYDSNPWRNLSDSAFASSQGSLSNSSSQRDRLRQNSEEFTRSTQSPVRNIYNSYLSKEPLFPRPLSRQSSISNFSGEGNKTKSEIEKFAQLSFLVKDLSDRFTKYNECIDYNLAKLNETIDQKFASSTAETQKKIQDLVEKITREVQVSTSDKTKILELENLIKEKDQQIENLQSKLKDAEEQGIQKVTGTLKNTILAEYQIILNEISGQNAAMSTKLENAMGNSFSSVKELIASEIQNNCKKYLEGTLCRPAIIQKDLYQCTEKDNLCATSAPACTSPALTGRSQAAKNIFDFRVEPEKYTPVSKSAFIGGKPGKTVQKSISLIQSHPRAVTPSQNRRPTRLNIPKQTPLKKIHRSRPTRSLISVPGTNKPIVWSYRGRCRPGQTFTPPTDYSDSISEASSPAYSVFMSPTREESPFVMTNYFQSGLNLNSGHV